LSPLHPLIARLVAEAGDWEHDESAAARLELGLLLELHNRPRNWDLYEENLPLALRVVELPRADQVEVVRAIDRLIREAPTEDARCDLLTALGLALPSVAMEPALRFFMDPPDGFAEGWTWQRVLYVLDHLLDYALLPPEDSRRAGLDGVSLVLERYAPEEKLARLAAEGPQLESERAASILRKLTEWRGGTWRQRIPTYAGGAPLERLLAGLNDADPGQRASARATLTRLLVRLSEEASEPVEERYLHLSLDYWAQEYVVKELERALLSDHQAGDRMAVLGVLQKADAHRALGLLFWVLADDLISAWRSDDIAALLMAVDEQLHRVASRPDEDRWGIRAGAEMASPALHRLTSSEATPVREAAAAVLEVLRVLGLSEAWMSST
jgi:hypothetical protein